MKDIKITVTKKVASVEGTPIIVCGNSDYTLSFTFDDEWSNEQNKVARFSFIKNGLKSFIDMPIHDNTCQVPVLIGIGLVRVGVYAGGLKTTTGAKIKCHKSILCDDADTMDEPFKNLYDELIKYVDEAVRGIAGGLDVLQELNNSTENEPNKVYSANVINKEIVEYFKRYVAQISGKLVTEIDLTSGYEPEQYPSVDAVRELCKFVIDLHREEVNGQLADLEDRLQGDLDLVSAIVGGVE